MAPAIRKKVTIAVELVMNPGLLFLDEPTTGAQPPPVVFVANASSLACCVLLRLLSLCICDSSLCLAAVLLLPFLIHPRWERRTPPFTLLCVARSFLSFSLIVGRALSGLDSAGALAVMKAVKQLVRVLPLLR